MKYDLKHAWLVIALLCLFIGLASGVTAGAPLVGLDERITNWFAANTWVPLTFVVLAITHLHDPIAISVFGIAFGLYLARRRAWRWLWLLAATLPTGMLLNIGLKHLFRRDRPLLDDPLLSLSTYSFPSGHVAGTALFYGVLAAFATAQWRGRASAGAVWAIWLGAALMVALVGLSRVYLGVHFFSDVVAAIAWSGAWLLVWFAVLAPAGRGPALRTG